MVNRKCNLECELQHEGYCTREDIDCTAKTNDDLMTEDEYDKGKGGETLKRKSGVPKRDGSGQGNRANRGRGGCKTTQRKGRGRNRK